MTTTYWCRRCDRYFFGDACDICGGVPTKKNTKEIK